MKNSRKIQGYRWRHRNIRRKYRETGDGRYREIHGKYKEIQEKYGEIHMR
jgi:hypothetical protein